MISNVSSWVRMLSFQTMILTLLVKIYIIYLVHVINKEGCETNWSRPRVIKGREI